MSDSNKTVFGKVDENERNFIQELIERKNGLTEFRSVLSNDMLANQEELYNRVVKDLGKTLAEINNWWLNIFNKYKIDKNINLFIDFDSCELYIPSENQTNCSICNKS